MNKVKISGNICAINNKLALLMCQSVLQLLEFDNSGANFTLAETEPIVSLSKTLR